MNPNLTGFVLAGGKSTRMGRDKATLKLDGRTLLEHALEVLKQVSGEVAILGLNQLYGDYGTPVIEDIYPGCGPLGGIHAALTHTKTEYNLIIAVDTPFLSPDFLSYMAERAIKQGAVVTTPDIAGYRQPLCSVYSREFLTIAEKALQPQRTQRSTEEQQTFAADERRSTRLQAEDSPRRPSPRQANSGLVEDPGRLDAESSTEKSKDYKIVPLFPDPGTLVINEAEMARFAFIAEMFENLNTPEDMARARERTFRSRP